MKLKLQHEEPCDPPQDTGSSSTLTIAEPKMVLRSEPDTPLLPLPSNITVTATATLLPNISLPLAHPFSPQLAPSQLCITTQGSLTSQEPNQAAIPDANPEHSSPQPAPSQLSITMCASLTSQELNQAAVSDAVPEHSSPAPVSSAASVPNTGSSNVSTDVKPQVKEPLPTASTPTTAIPPSPNPKVQAPALQTRNATRVVCTIHFSIQIHC
jgi:hypothetical protein